MGVFIKDISTTKRKLSKIIREYELDKISTEKFRSLVYGLSKYAELIKLNDIESRIEALENVKDTNNNTEVIIK